jgi:phosphopantetheinyl transferase (holo-ACP synthase)
MQKLHCGLEPVAGVWRFAPDGGRRHLDRRRFSQLAHLAADPVIAGAEFPHRSFAYSGPIALVAGGQRPLGIDLEPVSAGDALLRQGRRIFSPAEATRLDRAAGHARIRLAAEIWTRKEAVLKGRGTGITGPLCHVCTIALAADWDLRPIALDPAWVATVALRKVPPVEVDRASMPAWHRA